MKQEKTKKKSGRLQARDRQQKSVKAGKAATAAAE